MTSIVRTVVLMIVVVALMPSAVARPGACTQADTSSRSCSLARGDVLDGGLSEDEAEELAWESSSADLSNGPLAENSSSVDPAGARDLVRPRDAAAKAGATKRSARKRAKATASGPRALRRGRYSEEPRNEAAALNYVQDNAWTAIEETGLNSNDSEENTDLRPDATNLCGDAAGIPGGLDPNWVRVNGSPDPKTPFVEAEGQVLPDAMHATVKEPITGEYKTNPFVAATDDTFTHYMRDINVFVTLDPPYRGLLANGNFLDGGQNENGELEVEWERTGPPQWAWPAANDRIHIWGNHIWDCAHGGPYLGSPNIRRTEIHSPVGWVVYRNLANTHDRTEDPGLKKHETPWVWYEAGDHQGMGTRIPFKGADPATTPSGLFLTPVQATVADAFFSSFGGNTIEALNGCDDSGNGAAGSSTTDAVCEESLPNAWEWAQLVLQQDYTFFVPAPPKPTPEAQLVWWSEDRCAETTANPGNPSANPGDPGDVEGAGEAGAGNTAYNIGPAHCVIPDEVTEVSGLFGPGIQVTVRAHSGADGIVGTADDPSYSASPYVAFGKRYRVAWDSLPPVPDRVRSYEVSVDTLRVYDDNDGCGGDGEWVMSLRVNEQWIHPVRGSGDGGDPFWADGAIDDDKCIAGHDPTYKSYDVGELFTPVHVVPGEPINVWERSFDKDTGPPGESDPINPIVNAYHYGPGTFVSGVTDHDIGGAHTLVYQITDITDPPPLQGILAIGAPNYGPTPDTDQRIRISGVTPISMTGSDAVAFEWKMWKDGDPEPADWQIDLAAPFDVTTSGFTTGNDSIKWAPVSAFGIVGDRMVEPIQLDTVAPTLSLPPTMLVDATSVKGANVSFSATATDDLPGPVTVTCNPASGSFFPVKQVTAVHCIATDAVDNQSFGFFLVDVESPFGYVHDFVALGLKTVNLGSVVTVGSGNVGAFDKALTPGGQQVTEVKIGTGSRLIGGPKIAGDTVRLEGGVQAGEVFAVDPIAAGPGTTYTAKTGYVPLFLCLPTFPGFMAFGADLAIKNDTTLPPGNYGDLRVFPGIRLTLLGGTYVFKNVTLENNSALLSIRPTTVEVSLRVSAGSNVTIGPAPNSTNAAHDFVFYVQAPDVNNHLAWEAQDGLKITANVDAPNGTFSIGRTSLGIGAFLGNDVVIGNATNLRIDSAFDCPYPPPER